MVSRVMFLLFIINNKIIIRKCLRQVFKSCFNDVFIIFVLKNIFTAKSLDKSNDIPIPHISRILGRPRVKLMKCQSI